MTLLSGLDTPHGQTSGRCAEEMDNVREMLQEESEEITYA
nr:MAG TPA: hypothetical protein [Caudoviricetes sp.]